MSLLRRRRSWARKTLRDTVDASLREIVDARRRLELIALLSDLERYDLDVLNDAWGGES